MTNHHCSDASLGKKELKKRKTNLCILLFGTNDLWVDIDTKYIGKNKTIITEELNSR